MMLFLDFDETRTQCYFNIFDSFSEALHIRGISVLKKFITTDICHVTFGHPCIPTPEKYTAIVQLCGVS